MSWCRLFSHPTGGSLCKVKSPLGVIWILKTLRGCIWSPRPYNIAWQNWCLLLTCEPNGDNSSFAFWDHIVLPLWSWVALLPEHLHLFIALHPSFLLCLFTQQHSTVWKRVLRGCPFACMCHAPSQGIASGVVGEGTSYRAVCRACHTAIEKRIFRHYCLNFSVPSISSSSRLFRVTDAQLLRYVTLSCWRLEPPFRLRIPLFMSEPVREWTLRDSRLCRSGFQKEELCVSEHKL